MNEEQLQEAIKEARELREFDEERSRMEREHNKDLLAIEQEVDGWKGANRILKAKLEIAQKAFEKILREDVRKRLNDEDLAPRYREIAIIALKSLNEQ